ncbi:hypothetical protein Bca4012_048869 [Brassica carinata]
MMKMVKKTDEENHFSWCCFLSHSPLLFFLVTLITFLVFLYLLSSYGLSSLLVTIAILFISTSLFFLRFFKKRTGVYLVERSEKEGDNNDDNAGNDDDADDEHGDEDDDGLIEIFLVNEEAEAVEAVRNIDQSLQRIRVDEEEEINDVNMEEEDNFIEIDISIGSIKR